VSAYVLVVYEFFIAENYYMAERHTDRQGAAIMTTDQSDSAADQPKSHPHHQTSHVGNHHGCQPKPSSVAKETERSAASGGPVGETALPGAHSECTTSAASRRVLLADDEPVSRAFLAAVLVRLGYPCDAFSDGQSALDAFRLTRYALVLIDCHMPGLDGLQTAVKMREYERQTYGSAQTPIIAMTATLSTDEQAALVQSGMNACLVKPIDPEQLRDLLSKWLP